MVTGPSVFLQKSLDLQDSPSGGLIDPVAMCGSPRDKDSMETNAKGNPKNKARREIVFFSQWQACIDRTQAGTKESR